MVIREPDVFARTYNHPAGDVEWVLAGREHTRQPVQRSTPLASSDALVERGDHAVVTLAAAVICSGDRTAQRGEQFRLVGSRRR